MSLSGPQWVDQFPTSTSTSDLTPEFCIGVDGFIAALKSAGANVNIAATFRPPERAYLMHYAWCIARENLDPQTIPIMKGVDIDWIHKDKDGKYDEVESRRAASSMVQAYDMEHIASLTSRHTEGRAVDMSIIWSKDLSVTDSKGTTVLIKSTPRNAQNTELHKIGATYGVIKLLSDKPHWSDDGH